MLETRGLTAVLATVAALSAAPSLAQDPVNRAPAKVVTEHMIRNQSVTVPAEMTKKGADVVLQMKDRTVKVANPSVVTKDVRQLPVDVVLTPDAEGQPQVESMKLQAADAWEQKSDTTKMRYEEVTQAHVELDALADKALSSEATPQDLDALAQQVEVAQQTLVDAYKQLDEGARTEQRVLVEQHRELQTASKALYGVHRDDRYPPAAYQRIYQNSRGAFALAAIGEDAPRCSAVLIGRALALTNNHCLLENIPEELEARFDFETDLDGNPLTTQSFPIEEFLIATEEARGKLDFVLLKLGSDAAGKLPGEHYPVQCLSLKHVARDDALYVVGHPLGGPRTVHDNTFVYFPFRVTPEQLIELEILVRSEFDSFEAESESYREGKLKEFKDSYLQRNDDTATWYEYVSTRFGNQPTIGADSDTYRGNSGSPVYDRHSHRIVGLLFDGQDDLGQPWQPGWRAHEAILPITAIVSQIKTALPEWSAEESGVCLIP
jgi:hypothetical protein